MIVVDIASSNSVDESIADCVEAFAVKIVFFGLVLFILINSSCVEQLGDECLDVVV